MKSSNSNSKLCWFLASVLIPLQPSSHWKSYDYSKQKSNTVIWEQKQLKISVDQSSSPLVYSLPEPISLTEVLIKADYHGSFQKIPTNKTQGKRGADDFVLRFGLIFKGQNRLNWLQRQMAPDWLLAMEKQLPKNLGIKKVLFISTCQQQKLVGQKHSHFFNSLLEQECVTKLDKPGEFQLQKKFPSAQEIIGFWIASDGDDLKSKFELTIKSIEVNYNKKP